jgi:hypothetical protein
LTAENSSESRNCLLRYSRAKRRRSRRSLSWALLLALLAVGAGGEVTIASRAFTLGAVYARRPGVGPPGPCPPRRLLGYTEDSLLAGGRVTLALVPSGRRRVMTGEGWAAWAGEPVEDGPGDVGR